MLNLVGQTKNGFKIISLHVTNQRGRVWLAECQSCGSQREIPSSTWTQGAFRCPCDPSYKKKTAPLFRVRGRSLTLNEWANEFPSTPGASRPAMYKRHQQRQALEVPELYMDDEWVVFGPKGYPNLDNRPIQHRMDAIMNRAITHLSFHIQEEVKAALAKTVNALCKEYVERLAKDIHSLLLDQPEYAKLLDSLPVTKQAPLEIPKEDLQAVDDEPEEEGEVDPLNMEWFESLQGLDEDHVKTLLSLQTEEVQEQYRRWKDAV